MGCVYLARCKVNGKGYVGKTVKSLEQRKSEHRCSATHGSSLYFHLAIRKYGWDAFEWFVLTEDDDNEWLYLMEQKWIKRLGTSAYCRGGYNLNDGGPGNVGFQISDETREKLRVSHLGKMPQRVWTDEQRKQQAERNQNIEWSDGMRLKLSQSVSGLWRDPDYRQRQVQARIGKKQTEETKKKRSSSLRSSGNYGNAKLSEDDVRQIKLRISEGERKSLLAVEYGVDRITIYRISSGESWGWV